MVGIYRPAMLASIGGKGCSGPLKSLAGSIWDLVAALLMRHSCTESGLMSRPHQGHLANSLG